MSTIPSAITQPLTPSDSFPRTTTETVGSMRIPGQGRLSTLSSVVRPTPTTATRTVLITTEESRQDVIETARQLIGSASPTTYLVCQLQCQLPENHIRTEMRTRPTSPPPVPTETLTITPIGMATPIAPDLIWPSHPDIQ